MKAKMLFSLVMVISACVPIAAQTNAELQRVTLYNPRRQTLDWSRQTQDWSRSAINFETGKRGLWPSEGYFDLIYGGIIIGEGDKRLPDWFRVTDPRSMIVDLGAKNWPDIRETPPFPKAGKSHPPPPLANRPWVIDSSPGKEVSPYRQFIPVKPGHIYLMRNLHGNKVIYAMFRVESLHPEESCVLSWKQVPPPKVDNEK